MIIMLCHTIILADGENSNNYVGIKRQITGMFAMWPYYQPVCAISNRME